MPEEETIGRVGAGDVGWLATGAWLVEWVISWLGGRI